MDLTPPILRGRHVVLEPIDERHAEDLFRLMQDEEVCRYLVWPPPAKLDETLALVREAKALMAARQSIVFAQVDGATGRAIGSNRLLRADVAAVGLQRDADAAERLERRGCAGALPSVGAALRGAPRLRRGEDRALGDWGPCRGPHVNRFARLGAVREGVLRRHMAIKGFQRDTVYYSILEHEWPAVKAGLEARLAAPTGR